MTAALIKFISKPTSGQKSLVEIFGPFVFNKIILKCNNTPRTLHKENHC